LLFGITKHEIEEFGKLAQKAQYKKKKATQVWVAFRV